jgi:hypothetical protein
MAAQEEIRPHSPPAKRYKLEEGTSKDEEKPQLVERHWVKVEQSKESQNQNKLLKVMQWNMLADGII